MEPWAPTEVDTSVPTPCPCSTMADSDAVPTLTTNTTNTLDGDDEQLQSYVTGVTQGCNAFRILLIGKSGSGKSSLVTEVFDFELDAGNVSDFAVRAPRAQWKQWLHLYLVQVSEHDINHAILSSQNKSLILHDSKGLESGSDVGLKVITEFVSDRKDRPFAEQLHAIWCRFSSVLLAHRAHLTVSEGIASKYPSVASVCLRAAMLLCSNICRSRTTQVGFHSPALWRSSQCRSVPLIVVFTKLDRLQFRQRMRLKKTNTEGGMDPKAAAAKAETDCIASASDIYQKSCVDVLQSKRITGMQAWSAYCAVSIKRSLSFYRVSTSLTSSRTRIDCQFD